jgi:hypothetical protein
VDFPVFTANASGALLSRDSAGGAIVSGKVEPARTLVNYKLR